MIQNLVEDAQNFVEKSQNIYKQAEVLLLKSLGLDHPPLEGGSKSQLAGDSGRGYNLKTNSNFNSIKKFPDPSPNASHSTLPQGEGNSSQYCYNTSIASHSTLPQGEGDLFCAASQTRAQGEGDLFCAASQTRAQISLLIQESFALKSKSEKLLELAKQAVEMAIEESEEKAMKLIEQTNNF